MHVLLAVLRLFLHATDASIAIYCDYDKYYSIEIKSLLS